jgi:prepilin-type N-terminal cleavage/methylation domain-containing protein
MSKDTLTSYFLNPIPRGFTLIEIIVVFSILAIISSVGIASFSKYTDSQKLQGANLQVRTLLSEARSKSLSQSSTCVSNTVFQGYAVKICNGPGNPTCTAGNDYELDIICSGTYTVVSETGGVFPSGISVDSSTTNPSMFVFIPITGGVSQSGQIVLDGANSAKKTITITSTGVIQ